MYLKCQVRLGAKWGREFRPATGKKGMQSYAKKKIPDWSVKLTLPLLKKMSLCSKCIRLQKTQMLDTHFGGFEAL